MSKLLKSKILLGVMIVAVMLVGFAMASTTNAADCTTSTYMKVGSRSADVTCLQTKLGMTTVTGYFGSMTKAAVQAFQTNNGLTADGVVGAATRAALNAGGTTPPPNPTGDLCPNGMTLASNCMTLPGGSTGATCPNGNLLSNNCAPDGTVPPVITGGAGTITATETSTNVETTVAQGTTEKVYGFKVEAVDSDISLGYVKVTLNTEPDVSAGYRLTDYASEVKVYMGSTLVGSANASDFSKDGHSYSKNIALTGAAIKEGVKSTFYVEVTANNSIDSTYIVPVGTTPWKVTVSDLRYTDGTGLTMTTDGSLTGASAYAVFDFTKTSTNVKLAISLDSTPALGNVEVSDTETTDVKMLQFKMKASAADLSFDQLVVSLDGTTSGNTTLPTMISELTLKQGSDVLATVDATDLAANIDDATVAFDLDDTYTIDADTTDVFSVWATINDVDAATLDSGDALIVSLKANPDGIAAETPTGSVVTETGSAVGLKQTFLVDGAMVSYVSDSYTAYDAGNLVDGTIGMKFTVTAPEDADVTFSEDQTSTEGVAAGNNVIGYNVTTATSTGSVVTSTTHTASAGVFTVSAGSTGTFWLTVKFNAPSGFVKLVMNNIDGTVVSNIQTASH